jgi:PAS domain S-box-containing protein
LWEIEKDIVIGRNISKLFPEEKSNDEFIKLLLNPKAEKNVGVRKKINIKTVSGKEVSVIIILSVARFEGETFYTAFIQNISAEFV